MTAVQHQQLAFIRECRAMGAKHVSIGTTHVGFEPRAAPTVEPSAEVDQLREANARLEAELEQTREANRVLRGDY